MAITRLENISSLAKNQIQQKTCNRLNTEHFDSFKDMLNQAIVQEDEKGIKDTKPLSKEQLTHMIYTIKNNMDMTLLDALSMDISHNNNMPFVIHSISRFDITHESTESVSSNYWHTSQNNDAGKGTGHLNTIIAQTAKKHGVDEALIKSVIKVESNYNPNSTSVKGAMGLMQLMPETARDLGVQNPYDPMENVDAGTRYLKMLLKRYDGDVTLSLAAYNWGMGNIERKPDQMPSETKRYIAQVTNQYEMMKG